MKRHIASLAPFVLLLLSGCGGGEEESGYEWKCYFREDFGRCECYEVAEGASADLTSSAATEVDDCSGYELCMSFYDTLKEQGRCDCGPAGFELSVSENKRRDTKTVDSCPVD